MQVRAFLLYVAGIFVLAALTAYPAYLALTALGVADVAFDGMVLRLLKLYALLGLWPLLKFLGINNREAWGYGRGTTGRGFLLGLGLGLAVGIASLGLVVLALLAFDIRVAKPGVELSAATLGVLAWKSLFTGVMVGLIEETWFRGALHGAIQRMAGTGVAVVLISLIYAAVHFVRADITIPHDEIGWSSGAVVIANCFHRFRDQAVIDSLFALFAAGLLLALVRVQTGRIAECIGVHAGWVAVIKFVRKLTYPNEEATWSFVVGEYDGVIGVLVGIWFALLCAIYYVYFGRRTWSR
ncbi:MAG: CPBP family intramembrane glutamic endopeptidase [Gammaproteobacteria bacterium]|nr:CPBP family intramembrane glutamic endopeptidase [Gammaproteobacteria bacterium]